MEIGAFIGKFDDFRGIAGFHQFRRLQWKMGLVFLLPNSTYKWAMYIRSRVDLKVPPFQRLRWPESKVFQGWLLEIRAFVGKLDDFRVIYITVGREKISGSPPFQRLRWPETRKIQDFSRMNAENRSIHRRIRWFSSIYGSPLHQFRRLQ